MAKWSGSGSTLTATVVSGDTLSAIARTATKKLGKKVTAEDLGTWNNIKNIHVIDVGDKIKCYKSSSSSSSSKSATNAPTVTRFGPNSLNTNQIIAEWEWSKRATTASYKVQWAYATGVGLFFEGNTSDITVNPEDYTLNMYSTYDMPADCTRVRFRVKPIANKQKDSKGNETDSYEWTADWSAKTYWEAGAPPTKPSAPSLEVEGSKLTATVTYNSDDTDRATHIEFVFVKNDNAESTASSGKVALSTGVASYEYPAADNSEYKVRARAYVKRTRDGKSYNVYSDWSDYSSTVQTRPSAPKQINTLRAETINGNANGVYIAWAKVDTAEKYEIQYVTNKDYFDMSDLVKSVTVESSDSGTAPPTARYIVDLEPGSEYFFRIRAIRGNVNSVWSGIKSIVIGTKPSAPTTWSSTSTAIVGEDENVKLYWVHNSQDSSKQTSAILEITGLPTGDLSLTLSNTAVNNDYISYTPKEIEDGETEPTYECVLKTNNIAEGAEIEWRVKTAGVKLDDNGDPEYGPWSTQRGIDVYAQPVAIVDMLDTIESFPISIEARATNTEFQSPTGYLISIISVDDYETTDQLGDFKIVKAGDEVYSNYFNPDSNGEVILELMPGSIHLENGMSYIAKCIVSMTSGLTAEQQKEFTVSWTISVCEPNAEIGVDDESLTASIRPYCEVNTTTYYRVDCADFKKGTQISNTTTIATLAEEGLLVTGAYTTTGEQVYRYANESGNVTYYTIVDGAYYNVQLGTEFVKTETTLDELYGESVYGGYRNSDRISTTTDELLYIGTDGETSYTKTDIVVTPDIDGSVAENELTNTSEPVYSYADSEGDTVYYTTVDGVSYKVEVSSNSSYVFFCSTTTRETITNVWLSVYRREYDGRFVEIATDLDGEKFTTVTDPHPALDYARYRIVAADKDTGHIEYYDLPAHPVGGTAAVIQWDEAWTNFDNLEGHTPVQSALSGSMLKLPYNIDVSDSNSPDNTLVEYIGRSHPVSYYGTQLGTTSSWSMVVPKDDIDTLYALRRLAIWLGDVYVREPSGSGYWAQVTVSFSQKHNDLTIPVSLSITRVEGGA